MASLQAKKQTSIKKVSICLLLHHSQRPIENPKFKSIFHSIFEVMRVKKGNGPIEIRSSQFRNMNSIYKKLKNIFWGHTSHPCA
jgi:hypothetical protein